MRDAAERKKEREMKLVDVEDNLGRGEDREMSEGCWRERVREMK